MCAMRPSPNGFWLPVCIAKVIGIFDHRVTSMPRLAFEGLELCDGKLSRTVLRGLGGSNAPGYPVLGEFVIFYDITGFQRRGFIQIISMYLCLWRSIPTNGS